MLGQPTLQPAFCRSTLLQSTRQDLLGLVSRLVRDTCHYKPDRKAAQESSLYRHDGLAKYQAQLSCTRLQSLLPFAVYAAEFQTTVAIRHMLRNQGSAAALHRVPQPTAGRQSSWNCPLRYRFFLYFGRAACNKASRGCSTSEAWQV